MKVIHIHSRNVKKRLEALNHNMITEERNKKFPKFFIYLFEKTPRLLNDLTAITEEIKQGKIN